MSFKKKAFLVFIFFPFLSLYAESEIQSGTEAKLAISSLPEAKLTLTQSFTVPFLQGDGALVKDNNIKFDLNAEITPISMGLLGETVFTPVAFIELVAGGALGSGWNVEMFGSEVRGIGLNVPDANGKTSVDASPFDGTFTEAHFGGAFQFDLAAMFPGDWNHIVFRSYHQIGCKMYSRAGKYEPWFFESDYGENQNGWSYYGNYLLGYRMPIFLDTAGLLFEMEKYLYNIPGGDQWGDSLGRWDFALLMNFAITKKFSAALITQFRLYRNYSNFTYDNNNKDDADYNRYYQDRVLEDGRTLKFYRIAAILNYKFR